MRKFLAGLMTVLCMICWIPGITASAAGVSLYDTGNRLKTEENTEAMTRLQEASNTTGMNIIVVLSVERLSDAAIESATASIYDEVYGNKTDGVCFYIDLSGQAHPYDYLDTSGLAQFYYTNSDSRNRVNAIHSAVDKYLYPVGSEDAFGAVMEFANQLEYYYDAGIPEHYWVYDDLYHEYYHVEDGQVITTSYKPYINWDAVVLLGIIGAVVGLIIALITAGVIKSHYQFKYELSPTNYVNQKTVRYHQQYDHFVTERTQKTHIERSSGGGGGGHHSGGGHSHGGHGGGGHHR